VRAERIAGVRKIAAVGSTRYLEECIPWILLRFSTFTFPPYSHCPPYPLLDGFGTEVRKLKNCKEA